VVVLFSPPYLRFLPPRTSDHSSLERERPVEGVVLRHYIRDGFLFRENAAAKVGL
jgi:hypothetical protein